MLRLPRLALGLGPAVHETLGLRSAAATHGNVQPVRGLIEERYLAEYRRADPPPLVDKGTLHKEVSAPTKALLDLGDLAIARVREALPFGAGNTAYDLMRTRGRGLDAFMLYAKRFQGPARTRAGRGEDLVGRLAAMAHAARGGMCGDHAVSAAAALNQLIPRGTPIHICSVEGRGLDHQFVMVGDLGARDRSALQRSVVVDAWVPSAQALLGEDYKFLELGGFRVDCSFSASGRDLVRARLPHMQTQLGGLEATQDPPPAWDGVRVRAWTDTHATRGDLRIVYEAEPSLAAGRADRAFEPRRPPQALTLSGFEKPD